MTSYSNAAGSIEGQNHSEDAEIQKGNPRDFPWLPDPPRMTTFGVHRGTAEEESMLHRGLPRQSGNPLRNPYYTKAKSARSSFTSNAGRQHERRADEKPRTDRPAGKTEQGEYARTRFRPDDSGQPQDRRVQACSQRNRNSSPHVNPRPALIAAEVTHEAARTRPKRVPPSYRVRSSAPSAPTGCGPPRAPTRGSTSHRCALSTRSHARCHKSLGRYPGPQAGRTRWHMPTISEHMGKGNSSPSFGETRTSTIIETEDDRCKSSHASTSPPSRHSPLRSDGPDGIARVIDTDYKRRKLFGPQAYIPRRQTTPQRPQNQHQAERTKKPGKPTQRHLSPLPITRFGPNAVKV